MVMIRIALRQDPLAAGRAWATTGAHAGTAVQTGTVNARSALFDLYGDHLHARGGQAPVASLVRLLAPLGITAPAVRTAISRMVRQGWLAPVRLAGGPGYALTPRASRRLDEAAERIYSRGDPQWDGQWHVLVVDRARDRARRDRVRAGLHYLGYAPLGETTWISPRASVELDALLAAERLRAERFQASYTGDPHGLLARAWDLDGLACAYRRWLAAACELLAGVGPTRPTRWCSRCAARWSTSGASSCSPIRGCPLPCSRPGGPGVRRRTSSTSNRRGSCRPRPVSWTAACGRTCRGEEPAAWVPSPGHRRARPGRSGSRWPAHRRPGRCPAPRTGSRSARPCPPGRSGSAARRYRPGSAT
jgi:phenylacetic acid degradation operon negative regulatory protein